MILWSLKTGFLLNRGGLLDRFDPTHYNGRLKTDDLDFGFITEFQNDAILPLFLL